MPKRLSKLEVDIAADKLMTSRMCFHGIANTERILYMAWKLAKKEKKRQKEKTWKE